jgi:hypothetical protein
VERESSSALEVGGHGRVPLVGAQRFLERECSRVHFSELGGQFQQKSFGLDWDDAREGVGSLLPLEKTTAGESIQWQKAPDPVERGGRLARRRHRFEEPGANGGLARRWATEERGRLPDRSGQSLGIDGRDSFGKEPEASVVQRGGWRIPVSALADASSAQCLKLTF